MCVLQTAHLQEQPPHIKHGVFEEHNGTDRHLHESQHINKGRFATCDDYDYPHT